MLRLLQVSDRRIREWAHKYRQAGLTGLKAQWQGENALKLSRAQRADLKQRLQQYRPDQVIASDLRISRGQFWTVSDLQIVVKGGLPSSTVPLTRIGRCCMNAA